MRFKINLFYNTPLYYRLMTGLSCYFCIWLIHPLVTKWSGIYYPVFIISFFFILQNLTGILQKLLRSTPLHVLIIAGIVIDICRILIAGTNLIIDKPNIMIYFYSSLVVIEGVVLNLMSIKLDSFMINTTPHLYEDYKIQRDMLYSFIAILSSSIAAVTAYFVDDAYLQILYILASGPALYYQIRLYNQHK